MIIIVITIIIIIILLSFIDINKPLFSSLISFISSVNVSLVLCIAAIDGETFGITSI